MADIVPSVLATSVQQYNSIINSLTFAPRHHIDIMDGVFAKPQSITLVQALWEEDAHIDIHMMVDDPLSHVETLIAKQPSLVILHAESATYAEAFTELKTFNVSVGLALLAETQPDDVPELTEADHCLIFGGKLGSYGGVADLTQLRKIETIKRMNPDIEIGWDGGANLDNVQTLVSAEVNVINVGGAIIKTADPREAYQQLVDAAQSK